MLAVVGENGAGKSTLMKILAGVQRPDAGEILLDGKPAAIASVHDAEAAGIVLIHQELNLAENLDVAGNLFLGREPTWGGPLKLLDRRMYADAAADPAARRPGRLAAGAGVAASRRAAAARRDRPRAVAEVARS